MPELPFSSSSPEPGDHRQQQASDRAGPVSLQQRVLGAEQYIRSTIKDRDALNWAVMAFHRAMENRNIAAGLLRAIESKQGDPLRIIECANVIQSADQNAHYVRGEQLLAMSKHGLLLARLGKREQLLTVTGLLDVLRADASAELVEQYIVTAAIQPLTGREKEKKKPGQLIQHPELELGKIVAEIAKGQPTPDQLKTLRETFESLRGKSTTLQHLSVVQSIITACNRSNDLTERQNLWRESKEIWAYLSHRSPKEAEALLSSWSAVITIRPSADVCRAWRMAVKLYLVEGDILGVNMLTHHLKEIVQTGRPPQLLRQFVESLENGSLKSSAEALAYLAKLAAHGAAFALSLESDQQKAEEVIDALALYLDVPKEQFRSSNSDLQSYIDQQIKFDPNLAHAYGDPTFFRATTRRSAKQLFNPSELLIPPAERAYNAWRRVVDMHDGFGALRTESQRTPDGQMPSLVRFGRAVGKVIMLNARDSEHFPGKGFYLTGIELDRIFVPDPKAHSLQGGPYHAYKAAWPGYAAEFDDLSKAEFIFTRGMIIVSCSVPRDYDMVMGHERIQMSLVVLNAHFQNPKLRVAYLVDTPSVRRLLRGTGIPLDDFRGFDSSRTDLNQKLPSLDKWLSPGTGPNYIFDIGDPSVIGRGVFGDEAKAWAAYLAKMEEHNEKVRDWDERFRAARDGSPMAGLPNYAEEARLMSESARLEQEQDELMRRNFPEKRLWELTHKLMNLYDLFRVGLSYQHRGYIRGKEDNPPDVEVDAEMSNDDSVFLNPAANFVLHEAMRWHGQHAEGIEDRARYPVAVIADAVNHALGSAKPLLLDTYDMGIYLDDKKIVQLAENGMLSLDDEIYWQTKFLPLAKDEPGKFYDVRLLPRDSIGR